MSFILATDSSCDLSAAYVNESKIEIFSLTYEIDGVVRKDDLFQSVSAKEFYDMLRSGKVSKTSQVNANDFVERFEIWAQNGDEVVVVAMSEGLSGTYQSSVIAREEILQKYPEAKIHLVNTQAASGGQGLLVVLAQRMKDEGKSAGEVVSYLESIMGSISHYVTVDDLGFLKRGGRISPTAAFFGGMLEIKPLIYVDDLGKLVQWDKVRGRKNALKRMVDKFAEFAKHPGEGLAVITHADCERDANELKQMVLARYPGQEILVSSIGPVIGSHAGPGTATLFFESKVKDPTKGIPA